MRAFKSLKSFEKLLQTIKWSLKSLFNMCTIIILIYSIFSIFGCYLFSTIKFKNQPAFHFTNEFFNFDNFYNGIWTVFRIVSGENWPDMMREYYTGKFALKLVALNMNSSYSLVIPFFFSVIFFCQYIFLSLFLMIAIQKYSDFYEKTENPIEKFNENAEYFKKSWNKYASNQHDGYKMKINHLVSFFLELEGDISKSYERKQNIIHRYILELKLYK